MSNITSSRNNIYHLSCTKLPPLPNNVSTISLFILMYEEQLCLKTYTAHHPRGGVPFWEFGPATPVRAPLCTPAQKHLRPVSACLARGLTRYRNARTEQQQLIRSRCLRPLLSRAGQWQGYTAANSPGGHKQQAPGRCKRATLTNRWAYR